ncbi:MAG TPA: suppressor of fused domain protein [Chitinophagaceae bacterium]
MQVFNSKSYTEQLQQHYEFYFGSVGRKKILDKGPKEKLHPEFFVLEFPPNQKHDFYSYCTVGMSVDRLDDNLTELIVYAPVADEILVELLTVCASYHRNVLPLNIHHTVNIGHPWLENSKCDHGFISNAYLDGDQLELFNFAEQTIHCYWFIPITEKERDYHTENGCEALEQLFEEKQIDYLNPDRKSVLE